MSLDYNRRQNYQLVIVAVDGAGRINLTNKAEYTVLVNVIDEQKCVWCYFLTGGDLFVLDAWEFFGEIFFMSCTGCTRICTQRLKNNNKN